MESSAKFKEKLLCRQKQLEEQMISNRVRKLELDEQRLIKQIAIANKQSVYADNVIHRKMSDLMLKHE